MPPARAHDPFNDAPRRPTSRIAGHLQETYTSSGHALRSTTTTTTAGGAGGGSRKLFSTALSRRPTAAAGALAAQQSSSNVHSNHILADSDEGDDRLSRRNAAATAVRGGAGGGGGRTRRARAATETTVEPDEDQQQDHGGASGDFVIRDKNGVFLHEVPSAGAPEVVGFEEEERAEDARLSILARDFWSVGPRSSGGGGGGSGAGRRGLKRATQEDAEEDLLLKDSVMRRLREVVDRKMGDERWMFEPTDYLEELRIRNHGV